MSRPHRIHLHVQVAPEHADAFVPFLREARRLYERPGGIRIRLLRDLADPLRYVEIVEYADEPAYTSDQERVARDPEVIETLARWRGLLGAPVVVGVYVDVTDELD